MSTGYSRKMPLGTGRVAIVIELEIDKSDPPQWVRTITSIPGREGTMSRVWLATNGFLDQPTAADLVSWVAHQVDLCVATRVGVQGVLGLT